MMNKYLLLIFFIGGIYGENCISDISRRDIVRNDFSFHEKIQSDHFVIHFTTADVDSQEVFGQWYNLQSNYGYAQSIIDHLEYAYSIFISKGWESPPPDCDELITDIDSPYHCNNFGGNSLYDVYISNDAAGMVVPETPYPVEPYTGGYSSFMKISTLLNEYNTLPSWSYHVVAHELHHAIQMRYGYSVSGGPGNYIYNGWLFEQTASYMENVIYPNNIHLSTMLSNCNVTTPLTFPEYNIDYPADLYQYRSALWQKYMVESFGDSSIIRLIWEDYGVKYASGEPVSLFPIYNNAIELVTNNEFNLSDAYSDYAVWRYFTGNRALDNEYFEDANIYCSASMVDLSEESIVFPSEKGAVKLIQLDDESVNIKLSTSFVSLIDLQHVTESGDLYNIELSDSISYLNINSSNGSSHALVLSSKYTGNASQEVEVNIFLNSLQGDLNNDGIIDILDIIALINMILSADYSIVADINEDGLINVLDVIIYNNIILGY